MNTPRWLFEAYQIRLEDEEKVKLMGMVSEQAVRALKNILVGVLGLNVMPIEEPDPSDPDKMILRWQKDGEFIPMLLGVGRPDFLKTAYERIDELRMKENVANATSEIDGYSEDDLDFFDELPADAQQAFWNDPLTKAVRDNLPIYGEEVVPVDIPPRAPASPNKPGTTRPRVTFDEDPPDE